MKKLLFGLIFILSLTLSVLFFSSHPNASAEGPEIITKIEFVDFNAELNDEMLRSDVERTVTYSFPEGAHYNNGSNSICLEGVYDYETKLTQGEMVMRLEIFADPLENRLENPPYDFNPDKLDEIEIWINGERRTDAYVDFYNPYWRGVYVFIPVTVSKYEGQKHTVTFDSRGGTFFDSQTAMHNGHVGDPGIPERDGDVFTYWFKDETLKEIFTFDIDPITEDTVLYAGWKSDEKAEFITKIEINDLKYDFNDAMTGAEARENVSYTLPDSVKYCKGNDNVYIFQNGVDIYDDLLTAGDALLEIELYAEEFGNEVIDPSFDFDPDNLDSIDVWINGELRNDVTVSDYNSYWRCVNIFIPVTVKKSDAIYYTVTFNMNGHGMQVREQCFEKGFKAEKPADPSSDGYTFDGWYVDADFTELFDFGAEVTSDVTVHAKWIRNSGSDSGKGTVWIIIASAVLAVVIAAFVILIVRKKRSR